MFTLVAKLNFLEK